MTYILSLLVFLFSDAIALTTQPYLDFKEPVAVTATTTSTMVLSANTYRRYLIVQNRGDASVLIKFDSAHTGDEGLEIIATGNYELPTPPYNSVWVKAVTDTQDLVIYEAR
jgi:hypothetical protein